MRSLGHKIGKMPCVFEGCWGKRGEVGCHKFLSLILRVWGGAVGKKVKIDKILVTQMTAYPPPDTPSPPPPFLLGNPLMGLRQTVQLGPDQASDKGLHSLLTEFSIKNRLKATK